MGIRLLPLIVITSLALLGIKMFDIFRHSTVFNELFLVSETRAKSSEPENLDTSEAKDMAEDTEKDNTEDKTPPTSEENTTKESADSQSESTGKEEKQPVYTAEELEILQSLSKRREELNARERDIALQAALLKAAAAKMDARAMELKSLEEQASAIIKEYQQKEDEKIKSLVKIYENMKPKDAARIFEKMDMPILLEVVSNMKEAKAAPILAKMDPQNAEKITSALADRRKLPTPDNSYKN